MGAIEVKRKLLLFILLMQVGCDGIVGSGTELDRCGVCGGNNQSCRTISGIFTRTHLPFGYNTITKIPAGACNINITEMSNSRNYLALKYTDGTYILNGQWRLRPPGNYLGAGTEFKYRRHTGQSCPGQCVFAEKPTTQPVDVELLFKHRNSGIMYEFTVPMAMMQRVIENMIPGTNDMTSTAQNGHRHHKHRTGNGRQSERRPQTRGSEVNPTNHQRDINTLRQRRNRHRSQTPHSSNRHLNSQTGSRTLQHAEVPKYVSPYRDNQQYVLGQTRQAKPVVDSYRYYLNQQGSKAQPVSGDYGVRYYSHNSNVNPPAEPKFLPSAYQGSVSLSNSGSAPSRTTYISNRRDQPLSGIEYVAGRGQHQLYKHAYSSHSRQANDREALTSSSSLGRGDPSQPALGRGDSSQYYWRIAGLTECSQTCGGGSQETSVVCMRRDTSVTVTEENCEQSSRPRGQSVACSNDPCPAQWDAGEWAHCSVTCGQGMQLRRVECKQLISDSVHLAVSAALCDGRRPESARGCKSKPCNNWKVGDWGQCSVDCGHGQRSREVVCVGQAGKVRVDQCEGLKPDTVQNCDMGSCAHAWFHSHWSEQCSTECGEGYFERQVYCSAEDGNPLPEARCTGKHKPRPSKLCKNNKPCGGNWMTGPWTQCTVTCGNGLRYRDVVCMKKLGNDLFAVVTEDNCGGKQRPVTEEPCPSLPTCPAEWFMTPWTECSASCGTGSKTREIKCLDSELHPSTSCDIAEQPDRRQTCNSQSCDRPQLDQDPRCKDKWKHCRVVVQARLCIYKYYNKQCCASCTEHSHNGHGHHHQRQVKSNRNRRHREST